MDKHKIKRCVLAAVFSLILIGIDRLTKYLAYLNLKDTAGLEIIPGAFKLQYTTNHGAAFGMMQNKQTFFFILTICVLLFLLWFFSRIPEEKRFRSLRIILVFIFAGAVGNMIDRVSWGYVIDFFYISLIDFPVFNVADCYLTFSMVVLGFQLLFKYKDEDFERLFHPGRFVETEAREERSGQ